MAGYITAKALSIANDAVPDDNDVLPVMTATFPPPSRTSSTITLVTIVLYTHSSTTMQYGVGKGRNERYCNTHNVLCKRLCSEHLCCEYHCLRK